MQRRNLLAVLAALAVVSLALEAVAQPVFQGDPLNPGTGAPYYIPPGAPLYWPGADERYGSDDDVLNPGIVGDVDLVVRSVPFAGIFPPPAAGVANAPVVVAGGAPTGHGSDAVFQVAISDGAVSPAAGHPLGGPEMDGRGVLVLAYADLDGDGVIGPTSADGDADNAVELQEAIQIAGRQVALIAGGQAPGDIAVSLGAPASAGGLGIVLTAAAVTGAQPPAFDDGVFISTLLPLLPPVDVARVIGGNPLEPDPNYLVDIEMESSDTRWFRPSSGDPIPGEPYAIPLDGSSVSVDLLQARAGEPVGAALARPVDASFSASSARRLVAGVAPGGGRAVLEAIEALALADDGPGNAETLALFAADVLGNPTDPPPGGMTVTLEAGSTLRILSPDTDGNPLRETIVLDSAAYVPVVVDDAGAAGDGLGGELDAVVGGAPTSVARANPQPAAPGLLSPSSLRVVLHAGAKDVLRARARFSGAGLDPANQDVTLSVEAGNQTIYGRTVPAGTFDTRGQGNRFVFRDDPGVVVGRVKLVLARSRRDPSAWTMRFRATRLEITTIDAAVPSVTMTVRIGGGAFASTVPCAPNVRGTSVLCGD